MEVQEIFRCFSSDYYLEGLSILEQQQSIGNVYIFSDDFASVEKEVTAISSKYNVIKVENQSVIEDIVFLASFHRFVLANSTFSWWGAFMAESQREIQIVVPEQPLNWHREDDTYFPPNWTRIKS